MSKEKNYEGEYNSTDGFVRQNELEKEANECFGEGWEAEDDCDQIARLIEYIGGKFYVVSLNEAKSEDDIIVEQSAELERIDLLESAIKRTLDIINNGLDKEPETLNELGFEQLFNDLEKLIK